MRFSHLTASLGASLLFTLSPPGMAQSDNAQADSIQQEEPWEMSLSLGYVQTSGNTHTRTYNGLFRTRWSTDHWTHYLRLQALASNENGNSRAERYYLEEKSDFNLDGDEYLFVRGTYTDDRFSGFKYQASFGTGYGRHLMDTGAFTLQGFSGLGYRLKKETNGVVGDREGEATLTLGQELDWDISESSSVYQEFRSEIGSELTVTTFEVGLETSLIGGVATKVSFQARNNSDVPESRENTDTQTSLSLVYTF